MLNIAKGAGKVSKSMMLRSSRPRRPVRCCDSIARSTLDHGLSRSCRRTIRLMEHAADPMERTWCEHCNFGSDPIGQGHGHGREKELACRDTP
jgi:hypothetical protein